MLVLREDFRIWTLPAGGLEPNETWEDAAVRETLEETGYEVVIEKYVGEYWRPQLSHGNGDTMRVFVGRVVGGDPGQHDRESVDVRWFPVNALPKRTFQFTREHIRDALADLHTPVRKEQRLPFWQAILVRVAFLIRGVRDETFRR